jgi:hypothetical protein
MAVRTRPREAALPCDDACPRIFAPLLIVWTSWLVLMTGVNVATPL